MAKNDNIEEKQNEGEAFREAWTEIGNKLIKVCQCTAFPLGGEAETNGKNNSKVENEPKKDLSKELKEIL